MWRVCWGNERRFVWCNFPLSDSVQPLTAHSACRVLFVPLLDEGVSHSGFAFLFRHAWQMQSVSVQPKERSLGTATSLWVPTAWPMCQYLGLTWLQTLHGPLGLSGCNFAQALSGMLKYLFFKIFWQFICPSNPMKCFESKAAKVTTKYTKANKIIWFEYCMCFMTSNMSRSGSQALL